MSIAHVNAAREQHRGAILGAHEAAVAGSPHVMPAQVALPDFQHFPKIPRLRGYGGAIITEKLDGTNAQIYISDDLSVVAAGSRNRWITPESDNYGFATWVRAHRDELVQLGPGHHYGEWFGTGIQRGYDLSEKRFALFNVSRYKDDARPACCGVVPLLEYGPFTDETIEKALDKLRTSGSVAVPGFMRPEGIVVHHCQSRSLFKVLLENDDKPKGEAS